MAKPKGVERAEVVQRMKTAIKEGLSATKFISEMRQAGLSYRRADMLADWRTQGDFTKKEGLLRFVRKDRVPTTEIVQGEAWKMSREYMFNVRLHIQRKPGEPLQTQFVNIMSDKPMTIGAIETAALSIGMDNYADADQQIIEAIVETGIQRV